jgi:hypothetical protein
MITSYVSGETKATRFCDCLQPEFCVRYKLAQPTFTNTPFINLKKMIVSPLMIDLAVWSRFGVIRDGVKRKVTRSSLIEKRTKVKEKA